MLRITEIKLPLITSAETGHTDAEMRAALIKKLAINAADLVSFSIFKRGVDARKSHAILFVYSLDVAVNGEAKLLAKHARDPHVKPTPDTEYKFLAVAPSPQPSPTGGEGVAASQLTDISPSPLEGEGWGEGGSVSNQATRLNKSSGNFFCKVSR